MSNREIIVEDLSKKYSEEVLAVDNEPADVPETQIKKPGGDNSGQRRHPPSSATEPDAPSEGEENDS